MLVKHKHMLDITTLGILVFPLLPTILDAASRRLVGAAKTATKYQVKFIISSCIERSLQLTAFAVPSKPSGVDERGPQCIGPKRFGPTWQVAI